MLQRRIIATASALFLVAPTALLAQGVATGVVTDVSTNRPLQGVDVVIDGHNRTGITDQEGRYLLRGVPEGRRVVLFRLVGYRPLRTMAVFRRGETATVDGGIVSEAVQLDSVLVRGVSRRGVGIGREAFEERRRMGFGLFYDSTDMRRNEHRTLGDMARGHVGILVPGSRSSAGGGIIYSTRRNPPCPMFTYYDGIPMGVVDTKQFPTYSLESAEIYHSRAGLPMEYGGANAACGIILLWSRRGR